MKILRVRRGFTTNSSGANEYLPDGGARDGGTYDGGTPRDAGTPVAPSATARQPVLTTVQPWGEAPAASAPSSNATTVGVASLVVAGAFLVIPVVRLIRKKRRKEPARDES